LLLLIIAINPFYSLISMMGACYRPPPTDGWPKNDKLSISNTKVDL